MPTLEELRRWLEGGDVAGFPARRLAWDRPRASIGGLGAPEPQTGTSHVELRKNYKYQISAEGDDALVLTGGFKGRQVSDLARHERPYLEWLSKEDLPREFIDVVRHQLQLLAPVFFTLDERYDG